MQDANNDVSLLRFATAGSVDDGKSTLIGRLLYDAKGLFEDQLAALNEDFDLARITDGLRAEREQGITIDVAYRYFSTPHRRFIIADCPGHTQYTRNALTGMSQADVAVLLVDARKGLLPQTRRHAYLAAMMRLQGLVVCVNKMDAVEWSEPHFRSIEKDIAEAFGPLGFSALHVLPMSALDGANVTQRSENLDWFDGPPLLELLETFELDAKVEAGGRMPVQIVLRPENGEGRAYAGRVSAGQLSVNDEVVILPRGLRTRIASIDTYDGPLDTAWAPMSVSVRFQEEIDVSRGDLIATAEDAPQPTMQLDAQLACLGTTPITPTRELIMKVGAQKARVTIRALENKLDLETLSHRSGENTLALNDIGRVSIQSLEPIAVDNSDRLILIDPWTKETVAAGLVDHA